MTAADAQPVAVATATLADLRFIPEASAPARVESLADSLISAEVTGVIRTIAVRVGDPVAAGERLVELECSDYSLRVRELTARGESIAARADFARRQLDRARTLSAQQTVSRELLDQREADLLGLRAEQAANRAALDRAERERSKCHIDAPFDAVIVDRPADPGEYVTPGTPLLRLVDPDRLEVSARVAPRQVDGLRATDDLRFRHAGPDLPLSLRRTLPLLDPAARTRELRLEFVAWTALPGTSGRLIWSLPPALPGELLVRRDGQLGILLAQGDRARFHPLPEAEEGRPVTVDLPPDTQLITAGRFGLQPGDPIRVTAP
ncbi:MAG: efflux RND transporter periplasmic adaptor subunit [Candidatus Competibacterales bacterium]|nr:efflux RND transporter periplasmic adaptor subunit [Candidatus Competibacterales bacterium]